MKRGTMCDMQKMPTREDASCDEDTDMNFATFSAVEAGGTHFVSTGGQLSEAKLQQNASNATLSQVVGMVSGVAMGDGVQYMRTLDAGTTLQAGPQIITVPILLPGAKPGDPQQTIQIQVLNPNILQPQQQPKYMQIPIQGLQQGTVVTVAYSPEASETGGIQLVGQNSMGEGLQVITALPQEMQLVQPPQSNAAKETMQPGMHQVFITADQQIIINSPDNMKALNNNTSSNNNNNNNNNNPTTINTTIIKQECDDYDGESSQSTEAGDSGSWQINPEGQQELVKYFNQLPQQQAQALPVSLQQFLKLNPSEGTQKYLQMATALNKNVEPVAEAIISQDGSVRIQSKKKKKSKKKPCKPTRPKPGQVVIATTSDGTAMFCCPECQMAYPETEQLEIHLIVHKIERRFICGICGAGLKRKEHLERHKLGHNPERPYVCAVCCKGFKRREHLNLHAVIHSGVKTEMCLECGKGFYRKDHLRKHTRSHESKRARDEADLPPEKRHNASQVQNTAAATTNSLLPEITIHVPTSANMQVPVQINIPQHVMTSLAAAQQQQQQQQQQQPQQQKQQQQQDAHAQLEALLAQHT